LVYENYCGHIWHPLPWCEVIYTTPVIRGMENLPKLGYACVCEGTKCLLFTSAQSLKSTT